MTIATIGVGLTYDQAVIAEKEAGLSLYGDMVGRKIAAGLHIAFIPYAIQGSRAAAGLLFVGVLSTVWSIRDLGSPTCEIQNPGC